jgi:hypothetical protein
MVGIPASAQDAEFRVLPDGTTYQATVQFTGTEYGFWNQGVLGERIPLTVEDLLVVGDAGPIEYQRKDAGTITFPEGTYTITYQAPVRDNHIQATFDEVCNVSILLPQGFDVRNPLLGMISPGGEVSALADGLIGVSWEGARYMEIRFYDPEREILLNTFGTIWLVVAIVLILPYFVTRGKDE